MSEFKVLVRMRHKWGSLRFLMLVIASSWLVVGCGSQIPDVVSIEPQYLVYTNRFVEISAQVGAPVSYTDLIVKTESLGSNVLGQCTPASRPDNNKTTGDVNAEEFHNVVRISPTLRNMSSDSMKNVIFHELGHCTLGRGHDDTRFVNGNAASLMNSRALTAFPDTPTNPWAKFYIALLLGQNGVASSLNNRPDQIRIPASEPMNNP